MSFDKRYTETLAALFLFFKIFKKNFKPGGYMNDTQWWGYKSPQE